MIKEQKELVAEQIYFLHDKMKHSKNGSQLSYYKEVIQQWRDVLDTLSKAEAYGFDEVDKSYKG